MLFGLCMVWTYLQIKSDFIFSVVYYSSKIFLATGMTTTTDTGLVTKIVGWCLIKRCVTMMCWITLREKLKIIIGNLRIDHKSISAIPSFINTAVKVFKHRFLLSLKICIRKWRNWLEGSWGLWIWLGGNFRLTRLFPCIPNKITVYRIILLDKVLYVISDVFLPLIHYHIMLILAS